MSNPLFVIQETGCLKRFSFLRPNDLLARCEYISIFAYNKVKQPRAVRYSNPGHVRSKKRVQISKQLQTEHVHDKLNWKMHQRFFHLQQIGRTSTDPASKNGRARLGGNSIEDQPSQSVRWNLSVFPNLTRVGKTTSLGGKNSHSKCKTKTLTSLP